MGIVATQAPNSIPGRQDIVKLTGSDTGNLAITIDEKGLSGRLNDQPFDLSHITLPLQWIDASAVSGATVTLQVEPQVTAGYLLSGTAGADTLRGGAGNDNLSGGDGDDSLWGLGGENTLIGGNGADSLYLSPVSGGVDYIFNFSNGDTINLGRAITSISKGDGSGALGGAVQVRIHNSWTAEIYVDTDGIAGAEYSVLLNGEINSHSFEIVDGTIAYVPGVTLIGSAENDTLIGTKSNDSLSGLDGNDTLDGGIGEDSLYGGSGDDLLRGFVDGFSSFDGGDGFDTAEITYDPADGARTHVLYMQSYNEVMTSVSVFIGLANSAYDSDVTLVGVERLLLNGLEHRIINGTDNGDVLSGVAGVYNLISGNQGKDSLIGGDLADTIYGGWEADTLRGGGGDDVLYGGRWNDLLDGGTGNDLAVVDYLTNTYGVTITITDDRMIVDRVEEDKLISIEKVKVTGSRDDDILTGSDRYETLAGASGSDVIRGGGGNDIVSGGSQNDTLWGGLGRDLFVFGVAGDVDQVMDFHAGDALDFNLSNGSGELVITSYQAGDWEGLALGDIRYEDGADGTVRLYVGADEEAGADYAVDIVGLGTGALLSVTDGNRLVLTPPPITGGQGTAHADILQGAAGVTLLQGGKGNDLIIGGDGTQAAGMKANFADVTILRDGAGGVQVIDNRPNGEGADVLSGVELLRLNDRVVLLTSPDLRAPVPSAQVDEAWYLAKNPDVADVVARGLLQSGGLHFQLYGLAEGRQPNAISDNLGNGFSESAYLDRYADVRVAVAQGVFNSGYQHFQMAGRAEGRAGYVDQGLLAYGYDEKYYLAANPDVAASVRVGDLASGYEHFVRWGFKEGRDPNAFFDTDWYLAKNPDVAAAVSQGLLPSAAAHFYIDGWRQGRDPSAAFDISAYMADYPDVAAAGLNPLLHFLQHGLSEGRVVHGLGDADWL